MENKSFKVVLMRCCQREEKELETSEEAEKWEKMTKGDGKTKKRWLFQAFQGVSFAF